MQRGRSKLTPMVLGPPLRVAVPKVESARPKARKRQAVAARKTVWDSSVSDLGRFALSTTEQEQRRRSLVSKNAAAARGRTSSRPSTRQSLKALQALFPKADPMERRAPAAKFGKAGADPGRDVAARGSQDTAAPPDTVAVAPPPPPPAAGAEALLSALHDTMGGPVTGAHPVNSGTAKVLVHPSVTRGGGSTATAASPSFDQQVLRRCVARVARYQNMHTLFLIRACVFAGQLR
jgi:hypothetical protein